MQSRQDKSQSLTNESRRPTEEYRRATYPSGTKEAIEGKIKVMTKWKFEFSRIFFLFLQSQKPVWMRQRSSFLEPEFKKNVMTEQNAQLLRAATFTRISARQLPEEPESREFAVARIRKCCELNEKKLSVNLRNKKLSEHLKNKNNIDRMHVLKKSSLALILAKLIIKEAKWIALESMREMNVGKNSKKNVGNVMDARNNTLNVLHLATLTTMAKEAR
jgi:hypothetical protein